VKGFILPGRWAAIGSGTALEPVYPHRNADCLRSPGRPLASSLPFKAIIVGGTKGTCRQTVDLQQPDLDISPLSFSPIFLSFLIHFFPFCIIIIILIIMILIIMCFF
jgi:hypothetical protein